MADENIINRINKLLERAMHEATPEGERASCLTKADELMAKYKIDEAQLTPAQRQSRRQVGKELWEVNAPVEFTSQVSHVLAVVANHCNLRIVWNDWYRNLTVVGYAEDINYAKVLWITVYREFAGNLFPRWRGDRSFDANVFAFVRGGYKWQDIYFEAKAAGLDVKWPSGRFKAAYVRECKARGEEPTAHTQRHDAFRASYASSFQYTIANRLAEMRRLTDQAQTNDEKDKFALALLDDKASVDAEFYRMYPEYDPEVRRRRMEESLAKEKARLAAMTDKERAAEEAREARARKQYEKIRDKSYDPNGWAHGHKVAKNVDLSAGRNNITPNRTELD